MKIHGFGTRPLTDVIVKDFINSVDGEWHGAYRQVDPFNHSKWENFSYEELKEQKYPCAIMGILRGTERIIQVCEKYGIDYYYFDHAYMFASKDHVPDNFFNRRFYSLTKNTLKMNYLLNLNNDDTRRINKFKVRLQKYRPRRILDIDQSNYLIVPPTEAVCRIYDMNVDVWLNYVKQKIVNLTGDKVNYSYRFKDSRVPLQKDLDKANVVITAQSAVGIKALQEGIPVICNDMSMCKPVGNPMGSSWLLEDLTFPDEHLYNHWIDSLLASQFSMDEIKDGTAFEAVERLNIGKNIS